MTLLDLSSIGSLVSGVAVLMLLVYLSLQNRQMEKTSVRAGGETDQNRLPGGTSGRNLGIFARKGARRW